MDFFIVFLPFLMIFVVFIISNYYIRYSKMKIQKKNAEILFSKENNNNRVNIIESFENTMGFLNYLKETLDNKNDENSIIEIKDIDPNKIIVNCSYLKINLKNRCFEILQKDNKNIEKIDFKNIKKIVLKFKSYSIRRGSGKNSRTYDYNNYRVVINYEQNMQIKEFNVYNKHTLVSNDNGLYETESRAIGELLSKILKINLVRIDGTEVEWTKLDENITEKLKNFSRLNYVFKKEPFLTQNIENNGYCIYELKYYNVLKIVLGSILISVVDIIVIILLFRLKIINRETNIILSIGMIFLLQLICGLSIYYLVQISIYKIPKLKPIINIFRDYVETNLKFRNGQPVSYDRSNISEIEEIDVRYVSSRGYTIKLISDNFSKEVISFYNQQKANYLRDEILELIKKLN